MGATGACTSFLPTQTATPCTPENGRTSYHTGTRARVGPASFMCLPDGNSTSRRRAPRTLRLSQQARSTQQRHRPLIVRLTTHRPTHSTFRIARRSSDRATISRSYSKPIPHRQIWTFVAQHHGRRDVTQPPLSRSVLQLHERQSRSFSERLSPRSGGTARRMTLKPWDLLERPAPNHASRPKPGSRHAALQPARRRASTASTCFLELVRHRFYSAETPRSSMKSPIRILLLAIRRLQATPVPADLDDLGDLLRVTWTSSAFGHRLGDLPGPSARSRAPGPAAA